jgi:hypothetical protein
VSSEVEIGYRKMYRLAQTVRFQFGIDP